MKPNLVEIEKIIKPIIAEPKVTYDYSKIIFNIISLVMIIIGGCILYKRKTNKINNKIEYRNNITKLYKDITIYLIRQIPL